MAQNGFDNNGTWNMVDGFAPFFVLRQTLIGISNGMQSYKAGK